MGGYLVVTEEPAVSSQDLAVYFAEALQGIHNAELDADAYFKQMQTENQKMAQLRITIDQVKQYRKNPPANPSRMDPMLSYDLEAMMKEVETCKARVQQWTKTRAEALIRAGELKAESVRLQKELRERNKKGG